jgi:hypothetical protein
LLPARDAQRELLCWKLQGMKKPVKAGWPKQVFGGAKQRRFPDAGRTSPLVLFIGWLGNLVGLSVSGEFNLRSYVKWSTATRSRLVATSSVDSARIACRAIFKTPGL